MNVCLLPDKQINITIPPDIEIAYGFKSSKRDKPGAKTKLHNLAGTISW